jgi:heat shock protein HtpX
MSAYIGIQEQIRRNNFKSVILLLAFPLLVFVAVWLFLYFTAPAGMESALDYATRSFLSAAPYVAGVVGIWFLIAYWSHTSMINRATGAQPLERKENKRVYNLVENLCMAQGMSMPKINVIEDPALNAFASGLNDKSFTVTLTRGIINTLDDDELEGVIAHELMHIRNRDVRLLVITIIFVGIFSFAVQMIFRGMFWGRSGRSRNGKSDGRVILIAMLIAAVAYFLSLVFRAALSRKREYMADAGAADMTRKPWALKSALQKVAGSYQIKTVKNEDVKEMFFHNAPDKSAGFLSAITGLFGTHPPIDKRIAVLGQF